jgi:putative acetyltransferase
VTAAAAHDGPGAPAPLVIRPERSGDEGAVAAVHRAAFAPGPGGAEPVEVGLVAALRADAGWLPRLSLVAEVGGAVVGHVVCTRAWLGPGDAPVLGLGPLGVVPAAQGRGVGRALVHSVLGAADALDEALVGLLGNPAYYGRFGFVPARVRRIEAPEAAWGDNFQVRPLAGDDRSVTGRFRYAAPFAGL